MSIREMLDTFDLEDIVLLDKEYDDCFVGISNDIAVYKDVTDERVMTISPLEWNDELVIFVEPSYNDAIIGMYNNRAVYDYDLMVESLMTSEGWDYTESIEWVDYNTLSLGSNAPIVVMRFEEWD